MSGGTFVVSEVFGPTVQGEGASSGRRAMFLRLGRCNLDCAWCDTPYTWDWHGKNGPAQDPGALRKMTLDEIDSTFAALTTERGIAMPSLLVVTGGEPMLQRGLTALCDYYSSSGMDVEVETNGTLEPTAALAAFAVFNVSPKLRHSGVHPERAIVPEALEAFSALACVGRARFKFVCRTDDDLDEVEDLCARFGIVPNAVWIMPEGRSRVVIDDTLAALADSVITRGWNVSSRLHVQLWGDRRGV